MVASDLRHPERRAGHEPAGSLVQRIPGALRAAVAQDKLPCSRLCASANGRPMPSSAPPPKRSISPSDDHFDNQPIDLPLDVPFGKAPKMYRDVQSLPAQGKALQRDGISPATPPSALRLPTVAEKSFLITIGDRTVTGPGNRDQMVGPWQIPVADWPLPPRPTTWLPR